LTAPPLRIALDLSCAAEFPITGIGYAAIYQMRALHALALPHAYRVVATGDRRGRHTLDAELPEFNDKRVVPFARLAKYYAWTRLAWPPIEWFCGEIDLAHNLCHQTPATRRAARLVTVHDLSAICVPETHTARTVQVQTTLLRQCARKADGIIAVSASCKQELVERLHVPEERVHVVHNGVRLEDFAGPLDRDRLDTIKRRLGLTRDFVIHLGTLEPRKNVLRLLEAYTRARSGRRDFPQLLFVGKAGWKSAPILDALRDHGLGEHVVHAGYAPRADAVALLRGARACLYPSLYEGFGLPVLEAMAARTPVITSSVSSMPEVAGDTALLVNPRDPDEIADALLALLNDSAATAARVEAAHLRAQTMTWHHSAQALADVYQRYG
jgi:glycosyltransferase involved in cell wall biosynthesis